jgi:hypothetical protein
VGDDIGEAAFGFRLEQRKQPLRRGAHKVPQIIRTTRETRQQCVKVCVRPAQPTERLASGRISDLGEPFCNA